MKQISELLEYSSVGAITQDPFYVIRGNLVWGDKRRIFEEVFLEDDLTQEDWAWILFFSSNLPNLKRFSDFKEDQEFTYQSMGQHIDKNPYVDCDLREVADEFGFSSCDDWNNISDSVELNIIEYHGTEGVVLRVDLPTVSEVFKSYKEMKEFLEASRHE